MQRPTLAHHHGHRPPRPLARGPIDRYRVPDDLWAQIQPVLARLDPAKTLGRKRIDSRAALDAIIYRMLTGCPWNRLPKCFPDDSAIHRTYQRWKRLGVLNEIWSILLADYRDAQPSTPTNRANGTNGVAHRPSVLQARRQTAS
jgi:transposase